MDSANIQLKRIVLRDDDPRFDERIRVMGVGLHERMPQGFVKRGEGLNAWLMVIFHDAVLVELGGVKLQVQAGSTVLWNRNSPHFFGNATKEWDHSWLVFSGSLFDPDIETLGSTMERPLELRCTAVCLAGLQMLLREFAEFGRPETGIVAGEVQLILREIARETAESNWRPEVEPERLALAFIRRHFTEELSVERIADEVGLSQSRLQQRFKLRYGESVQMGVERVRMQEAQSWLAHSGLRIGRVAERAGYDDSFYFSRRFKKFFGISPSEFRAAQNVEAANGHSLEGPAKAASVSLGSLRQDP